MNPLPETHCEAPLPRMVFFAGIRGSHNQEQGLRSPLGSLDVLFFLAVRTHGLPVCLPMRPIQKTRPPKLTVGFFESQSQGWEDCARWQHRMKNRVLKNVTPTRPALFREILHVNDSIMTGEFLDFVPPQPGMVRFEHHVWVKRPLPASIPNVAHKPRALVLLNSHVDVFGDVFSNVFRDALSSGFDRHQLSPTETIARCRLAPKLPFGPKSRRCCPIIPFGKCLKITPRANIRVQNTQAVKSAAFRFSDAQEPPRCACNEPSTRAG